ncbi:MAG TPA: ATP-binding protein [Gaiellaceae bacterium]|nr:ATP-binding protein [Gaiellaceae bacterium]
MSDGAVRLTFPAKADYLLLARLALSGLARELPMGDEMLADLKLAVTEACGNAVRHAYKDDEGTVTVVFVVTGDRLDMIVEDQGIGPDALESEPVREPFSAPIESGMGMPIIRAIVDELEVARGADGQGTVLRMTKYLPTIAPA